MAVKIKNVKFKSLAYNNGIKRNEELISINNNVIMDILDYRFYEVEKNITLVIKNENGDEKAIKINKGEYEPLGLEFDTYLMDKENKCKNKCIFCFIDQLPKNMRKTLYFKDDDSRLSFLFGNYITLTKITKHEVDRIIKMHISPINVSVHTTDEELRCKMMNNRNAGKSLKILRELVKANIKVNCQIVLCPNINDNDNLIKTLNDLISLAPLVQSIAVVPVGLTKFREGLYPLSLFNKEEAENTIKIIEKFGDICKKKFNKRIVFAADEFYLKAQKDIPPADYYEDFNQLENGVGLISLLRDEFEYAIENNNNKNYKNDVTIITGIAAFGLINELFNKAKSKYNINGEVIPIKNNFFGQTITVSGLITGIDIINQTKSLNLNKKVLIPQNMLKKDSNIFLDDIKVKDIEDELDVKVKVVPNDGEELLNFILGIKG